MTNTTKSILLPALALAVGLGGSTVRAATAPAPAPASAGAPDYATWGELLSKYYDPAKGMNYRDLKAKDGKTLESVRQSLGQVDPRSLGKKDQLAYWINVYNVNTVATIVESYPVASIRDLSTDPIVRLNVFKKDRVPTKGGAISLNDVENDRIRAGFHDPRIHFAINCAAQSCPPIRPEPYAGAKLDEQLDDQARKFLAGPHGVRLEKDGDRLVAHVTKILDWFGEDFDKWAGGKVAFLRKYLPEDKAKQLATAGGNGGNVKFEYDDYSWKLNDTSK
ncbi:MAG TPA: DUF547 domain-containing protein [Thermoanaerobaculia bacterium]|nr:DUF547 domain-containing protein [Thermoanaerobaculia bacterium]